MSVYNFTVCDKNIYADDIRSHCGSGTFFELYFTVLLNSICTLITEAYRIHYLTVARFDNPLTNPIYGTFQTCVPPFLCLTCQYLRDMLKALMAEIMNFSHSDMSVFIYPLGSSVRILGVCTAWLFLLNHPFHSILVSLLLFPNNSFWEL